WDYRRFGASSLTSFVGLIGAYMKNTSETKEGKHFNTSQAEKLCDNVIDGSMHYDLRIYQTDVTPYSCLDPFGNQVSYRPLRAMDKSRVLGYHSTELDLLVSILRYVYHQKIDSLLFKNRAEALFSYTKDLSQKGDGTTEHLTGSDSNITLSFSLFDTPFPLLDGRNKIKRAGLLGDSISTFSAQSSSYVICTNEKNDFLIGVEKEGLFQPVVSYSSKDIDAFTLSLIEQSARGLGRTSLSELVDALHFRYSNEFTKLMREVKKF
ncbi:MAG: hypothetical protein KDK61_08830, partial [Simkania sp.]|nr:hypothetical protein [Simkania sp.]